MVLLKQQDENSIECLYDSTNIIGTKYNINEKRMAVIFSSGRQYVYEGVTFTDYSKFETSESQGKLLHTVIKKYPYNQSDIIVDVTPLKEQIEEIKKTL
jgi:hypothetical protein